MYIAANLAAVLVWLSLNSVLLAEKAKSLYFHEPKSTFEDGCHTLSRGPGVNLEKANPGLHKILSDLKTDFEKQRWDNFKSYFHPRAGVKKKIGDQIHAILMNRYTKPWQFSIYRVWQIQDKDNNKKLHSCPHTEFEQIVSRFGYITQYFAIIQIMGQNELGRIIVSIAPRKNNDLAIIGFHIQQWTHQGMDWQKWSQKGNENLQAQNLKGAYVAYSVAEKMLDAGDFIHYLYRDEIESERKKIFSDADFLLKIRTDAANSKIVYAGSLMHLEGTGIFVRVEIEKEENAETLSNICANIGKNLLQKKWLEPGKGGVKCSYIPKGSDSSKDSLIGGYYISQPQFAK